MDDAVRLEEALPKIHVPLWAWGLVLAGILLVYGVLQENGLVLASTWETLHEFFHDGRHAFGVPCH